MPLKKKIIDVGFIDALLKNGWTPDGSGGYSAPGSATPVQPPTTSISANKALGNTTKDNHVANLGDIKNIKVLDTVLLSNSKETKPKKKAAHTKGVMNKTEKAFLNDYIEPLLEKGKIIQWKFEALTLTLEPGATYTPDFMTVDINGQIDLYEVKNQHIWEDSIVKFKWAKSEFIGFKFHMFQYKKKTGWKERVFRERKNRAGYGNKKNKA
jgi:hypothetical protein